MQAMKHHQRNEELRAFRGFAEVAPDGIEIDSIVSRDPPEPDIACVMRGVGESAFELVEIVDKKIARLFKNQFQGMDAFRDAHTSSDLTLKQALDQTFGNALLNVAFPKRNDLSATSITGSNDSAGTVGDHATIEEAIERLCFVAKIEEGVRQSDARQLVSHDEVKKQFLS